MVHALLPAVLLTGHCQRHLYPGYIAFFDFRYRHPECPARIEFGRKELRHLTREVAQFCRVDQYTYRILVYEVVILTLKLSFLPGLQGMGYKPPVSIGDPPDIDCHGQEFRGVFAGTEQRIPS